MKHTYSKFLIVAGLILSGTVAAQKKTSPIQVPKERTCGTMSHHEYMIQTRPEYKKNYDKYNQQILDFLNAAPNLAAKNTSFTIPVVIHVVYKTTAQNITDAQASSQLAVLNADFQKLNSDTAQVPSIFKSKASGVNFNFCLAQRDPNGNATTGIVHKATTQTSFIDDDKVKFTSQGGDDAWDVTKYLNIWICNLGTVLLGYAEFPTTSLSNTYGLVINYTCAGTSGTATAPYNMGRTGTHEFGHCFDLSHIWGDDSGCTGSDLCSDTPNQRSENYGTPSYPQGTSAAGGCCSSADVSSMFMNYMDYTDDAAMFMFTTQQCARMTAVVSTSPWNVLQSSNGCTPVTAVNNDAGISSVIAPVNSQCNNTVIPKVVIKNFGTNSVTSAVINYKIDNGAVQTYTYSGSLASLGSATVTLSTLTATSGTHTFTAYSSLPNGVQDSDGTNDQSTSTFTVAATGQSLPFSEGFEGTTFVPAGWTLNNSDGSDTWVRTTTAAKTGSASALIDNFTNDFTGEIDEMVLPALDLTTAGSPDLSFDLAYKLFTDPNATTTYSDTLQILVSTDCGVTWNSLYKNYGAPLTTAGSPNFQNTDFIPTSNQWRTENVSLSTYASSSNAILKFRNISQYEQYMYIDNVNISSTTTGIKTTSVENEISIFPNPSGGMFNISIYNPANENVTLIVINSLGQQITKVSSKTINGIYNLDLSGNANGVYFVNMIKGDQVIQKRIMINK
jgi:hypothetical protein